MNNLRRPVDKTWDIKMKMWDKVQEQVNIRIVGAVWDQVWSQVGAPVQNQVGSRIWGPLQEKDLYE